MGATAAEIDAALVESHGIMQAAAERILAVRQAATQAAGPSGHARGGQPLRAAHEAGNRLDALTDAGRRAHARGVQNFQDTLARRDYLASIKVTTEQFDALPSWKQEQLLALRHLSTPQLLFRSRIKRAASILAETTPEWWQAAQRLHAAAADGGALPCDGFGCAWDSFIGNEAMLDLVSYHLYCPVEHFTREKITGEKGTGRRYDPKKAPASYILEKQPVPEGGQWTDHLVRFLFTHECFGKGWVVEVYYQAGVVVGGTGSAYQRVRLLTLRDAARLETVERLAARLGDMSEDDAGHFFSDAADGRITW